VDKYASKGCGLDLEPNPSMKVRAARFDVMDFGIYPSIPVNLTFTTLLGLEATKVQPRRN
jgi:hypothetical protein